MTCGRRSGAPISTCAPGRTIRSSPPPCSTTQRDLATPVDPGGLGDGARRFARDLRLRLMREHLTTADDALLLDPDTAAETVRRSAAALEAWHAGGRVGPRPPGRLRPQRIHGHGARTPGPTALVDRTRLPHVP